MTQDDSKYTDPELREQIKEDITESDKGGQPGQWSARKAQMVASEYKKQGGEYTQEKDDTQQNLTNWGQEEWQTKEGSGTAKQADGTEQRYLPKEAWEKLTDQEKEETEQAKHKGQVAGDQHVPNTEAAKEARKEVSNEQAEKKEDAPAQEEQPEQANGDAKTAEKAEEPVPIVADEEPEEPEEEDEPEEEQSDYEDGSDGEPASKSRKTENGSTKATRKAPSRASPEKKAAPQQPAESNEHGEPGSVDRLPEVGQKVYWKAGASMTEGEVLEIIREETMLGKRKFKASEKDPRVKVKSAKSGKEAINKAESVYWS